MPTLRSSDGSEDGRATLDYEAGAFVVDIPRAVTQTDGAGKPYTAYEISVAFQRIRKDPEASPVNVGWVLLKRYSEFKELLAKLSSLPRHRAPSAVGRRGRQWGPRDSAEIPLHPPPHSFLQRFPLRAAPPDREGAPAAGGRAAAAPRRRVVRHD